MPEFVFGNGYVSLDSLIFLNQQLTRFFYDRYRDVRPFQKSHRVADQLFYRYFYTTIKTKFIFVLTPNTSTSLLKSANVKL